VLLQCSRRTSPVPNAVGQKERDADARRGDDFVKYSASRNERRGEKGVSVDASSLELLLCMRYRGKNAST